MRGRIPGREAGHGSPASAGPLLAHLQVNVTASPPKARGDEGGPASVSALRAKVSKRNLRRREILPLRRGMGEGRHVKGQEGGGWVIPGQGPGGTEQGVLGGTGQGGTKIRGES